MNQRFVFWSFALIGLAVSASAYDSIKLSEPVKADGMLKPVAAAASTSRLYVLDAKKSQLFVFDAGGKLLKTAGGEGSSKSSFSGPRGLALGPDGKLFVADTDNSRVQILDADGAFLGSFGARGSDAGQLRDPESVSVGQDGRVYVADTGNNRIQVFTEEGILLFQLGESGKEPGQFKSPTKVVVDPSDEVYVLDSGNGRIEKFDASAKLAKVFPVSGNDFTVDNFGYLYVLEGRNGKVAELNALGVEQGRFGSYGSGPGQMKKAEGVGIGADGSVLVADTGNARVVRVELSNKDKTAVLPLNVDTKILVSGPSAAWKAAAEGLAVAGDALFAWLPDAKRFSVLDAQGKESARFGESSGPSVTKSAQGFAFSSKLGFFVADGPNNRLQQFTAEGKWKRNIAESTGFFDSKKKEGRVKDPRGVAINDEGTIYVADAGNRRVDAFNPDGVFLFGIGPAIGSLELQEPQAVAYDAKARFLYVADKQLKKVIKCEPSGAFIASFGEPGSGPGQFQQPAALAFDGNSYLYVLDTQLKRVSVYSKSGRWMTDLFAGGKDDHALMEPVGLAVSGSRLYVADKGRGKILSFDIRFHLAAPTGLAAEMKDGAVDLKWKAASDAWADGYELFRSSQPAGPFEDLGKSAAASFQDTTAAAEAKYWYRVATRSKTGDVGVPAAPLEFTVGRVFNKPPVELSTVTLGNVFSANYKWYLKNPVGTAVITNNVHAPFENVKLTFRLKDYMDFGYDQEIKKLEPQQTVDLPLIATLNNKVLDVSEDTAVQAEFTLTYFEGGQPRSVSLTKPMRIYSRNAITWKDPQRIANFITPKDPPILDFARAAVRTAPTAPKAGTLNHNVAAAMHLWDALAEYGMTYFTNPSNPYETISEDPNFPVDYTQFPRETLKRKSGQCDDLTTLLASMLEGVKVKTAVLDYPGHMALAFDTGSDDLAEAGLPETMLIKRGGTYWVPLETTMIGKPFPDAVAKAAQAYEAEQKRGKASILDLEEAWQQYEPATMAATDWSPEAPAAQARQARFASESSALFEQAYPALKKWLEALSKQNPSDADAVVELGLLEHEAGRDAAAADRFKQALTVDAKNAAALNDLGNVAFVKGDYAEAAKQYLAATGADGRDADLWVNLVRAEVKLKDKAKAQEYGKKAADVDPDVAPAVQSWLGGAQ